MKATNENKIIFKITGGDVLNFDPVTFPTAWTTYGADVINSSLRRMYPTCPICFWADCRCYRNNNRGVVEYTYPNDAHLRKRIKELEERVKVLEPEPDPAEHIEPIDKALEQIHEALENTNFSYNIIKGVREDLEDIVKDLSKQENN